jgi:hypothetical protein
MQCAPRASCARLPPVSKSSADAQTHSIRPKQSTTTSWRRIAAADLLVVDVTGLNPNVMIQFGVAAALRRPGQVILIKSADDTFRLPFNAFAQRYVSYRKSILGDPQFIAGLQAAMIQAITPAPYVPSPRIASTSANYRVDFRDGDRPDLILSPAVTHRRCVDDCLEYGSFFVFRNSRLLLTSADYRNVRVKASFRFGSLAKDPRGAFFGVSLRNHHFHANWGHFVYLRGTDSSSARSRGMTWENIAMLKRGKSPDSTIGPLTSSS